jgi:hypothetical protein
VGTGVKVVAEYGEEWLVERMVQTLAPATSPRDLEHGTEGNRVGLNYRLENTRRN